jgi:hypothetical protein
MIAEKLCQCLQQWGIEQRRVIMVVTDNGANMITAVRVAAPAQHKIEEDELIVKQKMTAMWMTTACSHKKILKLMEMKLK